MLPLPPRWVNVLEMAALEQIGAAEWRLSLEPWYALLLSLLDPRFVQCSRDGWQQFANGAESEISFEGLSPEQEDYLHEFIETFSSDPVLGTNPQLAGNLPDGPDFAVALGFGRSRSGQLSALAGLLRDYRQGSADARRQLLALLEDMCRWIPWHNPELPGLVACVPSGVENADQRTDMLAEDLAECLGPTFCNAQVCVRGLGYRCEDELVRIRQWEQVRRERRLHLSDSADGMRVLIMTEVCHHGVGIQGLAGCLRDLGASEVAALACVKTGGER